MINFTCPSCQKRYRLDDKFGGKRAKCKGCGEVMAIPAPPPNEDEFLEAPSSLPGARPAPPHSTANPASTPPTTHFAAAAKPTAKAPGRDTRGEASQNLRGTTNHLQYEISQRPDFSIVKVQFPEGRQVFAEPSAMVSMTPSVHLDAGFKGGIGKTFGRLLGGESLIINTFTAKNGPGEVMFAGGAAGDVAYHRLEGNSLYLQRGAYMLNSAGVEVSGKWQGAKGFFSGEGLVLLKATGTGDIFFNSYGAIIPIDVTEGFIVDTGYIVAFEESLQYRVTVLPGLRTAGKIKSFFFGGEGLVCQFAGTGRVWVQTRQVKSFLSWAHAFRPAKSN